MNLLKPFQKDVVQFCLERQNSLMALEMGTGKTICAIGVFNALPAAHATMLVVCPANLVLNWAMEIEKWTTRLCFVATIMAGRKPVHLVEDVWVISYDLAKKWKNELRCRRWDLLVCDESHYLKNQGAQRTKEVLGPRSPIPASKRLFLTGTPILSRPLDLWTTLRACSRNNNPQYSWWDYVHRYCDAHRTTVYTKRGPKKILDCTGASNLQELHDRIQPFMIRRLKKDVLKELPPKVRQKIVLPAAKFKTIIKEERRMYEAHQEKRIYTAQRAGEVIAEQQNARLAVAQAKLPFVIDHVRNILEQEDKVILFYYHHAIGDALAEEFKDMNPALINGNVAQAERMKNLERFQTDAQSRILLGSISTAVGYSATAASVTVFCELDWVPGNLHQAEDRSHRIGQSESVLVQYLVLEGSVDDDLVETLTEKTAIVQQVL